MQRLQSSASLDHYLKVFPEAVSKGGDGYLQLDLNPVNIALINAIKELKEDNDRLRSENAQLASRLERIESAIGIKAGK